MAKQGEREYLKKFLENEDLDFILDKPFTHIDCGEYLADIGAIMTLLPEPPSSLLDVGCGTGWTSCFFAQQGHNVLGMDIAEDMIYFAEKNKKKKKVKNLSFIVGDYEDSKLKNEYDCAVFFDSLHHAENEYEALKMVHRALKDGGICVIAEPGKGHGESEMAKEAVDKFDVTEKEMPPKYLIKLGKSIGFKKIKIYPRPRHIVKALYNDLEGIGRLKLIKKFLKINITRYLIVIYAMFHYKKSEGFVVMVK